MTDKPSDNEEEYFRKQEIERLRLIAEERHSKLEAEEREQAKKLHFMKCPKCGMDLHEVALSGVKVDKCFSCEGMWLDAGELQTIERQDAGFMGRLVSSFRF